MELKAATIPFSTLASKPATDHKASEKVVAQDGITQSKQKEKSTIEYGYRQVIDSMRTANIRGNAVKSMDDGRENYSKIGLLNLNTISPNGPKSVSVELTAIRRDTLTMMNKLPIEVNIAVADKVKKLIELNKFPTDVESVNREIQKFANEIANLQLLQDDNTT